MVNQSTKAASRGKRQGYSLAPLNETIPFPMLALSAFPVMIFWVSDRGVTGTIGCRDEVHDMVATRGWVVSLGHRIIGTVVL